jgi:hypothetical protein
MLVLERDAPRRFRCRLAGTGLSEIYGFEPAGLYLEDVMPSDAVAVRIALYEKCLGDPCAVFSRIRFAVPGREFVASDRLYVPTLGDRSDEPTVLFGAQRYLVRSDIVGEADADGVYALIYDDPVT